MIRWRGLVATLAVAVLCGSLLSGDDKKPAKGRLPSGWKKLKLTGAQREKILAISATYQVKIKDLQNQLKALRKKQLDEMVEVLTPEQKKLLPGKTGGTDSKDKKDSDKKDADSKDKKKDSGS